LYSLRSRIIVILGMGTGTKTKAKIPTYPYSNTLDTTFLSHAPFSHTWCSWLQAMVKSAAAGRHRICTLKQYFYWDTVCMLKRHFYWNRGSMTLQCRITSTLPPGHRQIWRLGHTFYDTR
jgi:hypothetical protein